MINYTLEEDKEIFNQYDELIKNTIRCDSPEDKALIEKAFKIANG